jgi:choline dehydrogenase-like flavoprotein
VDVYPTVRGLRTRILQPRLLNRADPHDGVVDIDCRVHGVDNLFIAGSSVFPTTGHANPTLTIVALAVRLADTLRTLT